MIKINPILVIYLPVLALTAWLAQLAVSSSANAAMTQSQVAAATEKSYDVRVLKIYADKENGKSVFRVKVMYNGGDWNTAFQVNTIVIDAETGERVAQFKHQSSGRSLPGNYDSMPNRQPPDALRRHIWR
ncbi:MAG TPA: hypothetical protein EYM96_10710 [Rhodospirillales bacterium]|nr:hypothetical protein [Rhodospirillales bacterium]